MDLSKENSEGKSLFPQIIGKTPLTIMIIDQRGAILQASASCRSLLEIEGSDESPHLVRMNLLEGPGKTLKKMFDLSRHGAWMELPLKNRSGMMLCQGAVLSPWEEENTIIAILFDLTDRREREGSLCREIHYLEGLVHSLGRGEDRSKRLASFLHHIILPSTPPPCEPSKKQGAVFMPIIRLEEKGPTDEAHQWGLLFTVRTMEVATHKGQVSFPGGSIERGETARDAALRESCEELGVDCKDIVTVGCMGTFPTLTMGWEIRAFTGFLWSDSLKPQTKEVDRVFHLSLANLYEQWIRQGRPMERPEFHEERGPKSSPPIWGATARMTAFLLERLEIVGYFY